MKNKFSKISFAIFLIILSSIVVIAIIFSRQKNQKLPIPLQPTLPEEARVAENKNSANQYKIEQGEDLTYKLLQSNPAIVNSIKKILPDFKIDDMGTSTTASTATLSNDKKMMLLWGCTPDNCGGTAIVAVFSQEDNIAYILKENNSIPAGYEVLDSPSQEIHDLLIYYYKNY